MSSTITQWWDGATYREDRKTSTTTPDFHSLVAAGIALPDNPFSHYGEWKTSAWIRTFVWVWSANKWQYQKEDVRWLAPPGIGLKTFDWTWATNAFLAKVKTQSVSVLTMLAERKKTAALLKRFASNILYTVVHWKRPRAVLKRWLGSDKKARRWATRKLDRSIARCTQPAEAWLEYRFAIRPMMYDIVDALEAFEKGSRKQRLIHVSRKDWQEDTTVQKGLGPYGNIEGVAKTRWDWKIVGRFRVSDPSLAALGNLAGVGASLWDLVPFSFVVDWAWDISKWLDLQNATLGLTFVSGFTGLKTTISRSYTPLHRQTTTYRYTPAGEYPATWRSEYYRRELLASCPTPLLEKGTLSSILGNGRYVDMLALARQVYLGKVRATYHFSDT